MQELKARLFDIIVKDIYTIITTSHDFEKRVNLILDKVGKVLDVDRICVFEHVTDDMESNILHNTNIISDTVTKYIKTFEYDASGIEPLLFKHDITLCSVLREEIMTAFNEKGFIEYRTCSDIASPMVRRFMKNRDIKYMLIIPIEVDNNYWGFMIFNDCIRDRIAQEYELDILKYMAFNIGAAIFVRRQHKSIRKLNNQLEQALKIAQGILERNTKNMLRENEVLKNKSKHSFKTRE